MKLIREGLLELNKTLLAVNLSYAIVDGLIFLMVSLLFLASINLWWGFALIPAAVYFIVHTNYILTHRTYKFVESKVPVLKEALRTAADNQKKETYMAKLLQDDVIRNLAKIKSSYFLDLKMLGAKLASLCVVAILVIMVSAFNVQFGGVNVIIKDVLTTSLSEQSQNTGTEVSLISMEGTNPDIFGEKRIATLSSKQLELQINPIASELDINIITEVIDKDFYTPEIPKEIYTSADKTYTDNIPQQNQEVVKNYFKSITG